MVSLNIHKTKQMNKRCKIWQKKTGFEITNETEGDGQLSPKTIGISTVQRCIPGPNLEILTSIGGDMGKLKMGKF